MTRSPSRGPDVLPPVSTLGDIESRMGLPSVESLLAERDTLVQQIATLRAKHGPFGTFEALRKIELATIASSLRARALSEVRKITEAAIDEAAHADERYVRFMAEATQEKAEWAVQENRIVGIGETINRGNVIGRYLAAELHLS